MAHSLAGKVGFVTGASSGIGEAVARELARRGADVALAARRIERLEALAAEIRAMGRRAAVLSCDVTREGDLDDAVARTIAEFGRIDIVFANAGFGVSGSLESLSIEDYRRQFETNVFGALRTVQATLPELKRTRGRLAITGSVLGHVASWYQSAYCMSKFAVRALAGSLRRELEPSGVSVTLISPGYVKTEIHQVDNLGGRHPEATHRLEWLRMPAGKAARQIVSAVVARRRERIITVHGRLFVYLDRYLPWLPYWVIRFSRWLRYRPNRRSRVN
ncbi:MAG: SDR family NAD(P)-dependent oxidoreductase [Acidobacteria bacterium]|nr:SDR family NAD(P)-dependent oxidoreductase [Acidobacteriota bacterium]